MLTLSVAEAQNRFGELIDRSQREPIQVTRQGQPVAYVISGQDMQAFGDVNQRREVAHRWYVQYRASLAQQHPELVSNSSELTDADVTQLVHELR